MPTAPSTLPLFPPHPQWCVMLGEQAFGFFKFKIKGGRVTCPKAHSTGSLKAGPRGWTVPCSAPRTQSDSHTGSKYQEALGWLRVRLGLPTDRHADMLDPRRYWDVGPDPPLTVRFCPGPSSASLGFSPGHSACHSSIGDAHGCVSEGLVRVFLLPGDRWSRSRFELLQGFL